MTNAALRKLFSSATNEHIFTFVGTQKVVASLNSNRITVTSDTADLQAKLGITFCSRPGEKPPSQLPAAIVIYKPGTAFDETTAGNLPVTSNRSTPETNNTPIVQAAQHDNRTDADTTLKQISADIQAAATDPARRKAAHAQLAKAQAEFTWDYRFSYEKSQTGCIRQSTPRRSLL